jgi:hypothetical protein
MLPLLALVSASPITASASSAARAAQEGGGVEWV